MDSKISWLGVASGLISGCPYLNRTNFVGSSFSSSNFTMTVDFFQVSRYGVSFQTVMLSDGDT